MRMAIEPKTSPRRVRGRERQLAALGLRMRGLTFAQIGRELGVTTQAAHGAVSRALARSLRETSQTAEELRALELHRLDAMLAALWPMVEAGEIAAINAALRVGERRAKLTGIDAVKDEKVCQPLLLPDIFAVPHPPGWRPTVEPTQYDEAILASVRRVPASEDEH